MGDKQDRGLSDEELQGVSGGATQDPANTDSLSELGDSASLSLQMTMARMAAADSTASTLLKKASDTSSSIIGNMK